MLRLDEIVSNLNDDSLRLDTALVIINYFEEHVGAATESSRRLYEDTAYQRNVMASLHSCEYEAVVAALLDYVQDHDSPTILFALGKTGDRQVLPVLDSILSDEYTLVKEPEVAWQALTAITNFSKPPLNGIQYVSRHGDTRTRKLAQSFLAEMQ